MNYEIDCENHPAFKQGLRPGKSVDPFYPIFAEADQAIEEFTCSKFKTRKYIEAAQSKFNDFIDSDPFVPENSKYYFIEAFNNAINRRIEEKEKHNQLLADFSICGKNSQKHAEELYFEGYTLFKMPQEIVSEIKKQLLPDILVLQKKMLTSNEILTLVPEAEAGKSLLNEFCCEAGVFETLSTYMGQTYSSAGFALHVSHARDRWYHPFEDLGLRTPQTVNMHFDLEFSVPKAMLYLSDVSDDQGPFSVIPRNSPWENISIAHTFGRELPYSFQTYSRDVNHWEHAFKKSVLANPGFCEVISCLPRSLRQCSHFGDVVADGTARSQFLLGSEKRLVGEAGTMPLFSGSHAVHRGGVVSRGERWALQIIFEPDKPTSASADNAGPRVTQPNEQLWFSKRLLSRMSAAFKRTLNRNDR